MRGRNCDLNDELVLTVTLSVSNLLSIPLIVLSSELLLSFSILGQFADETALTSLGGVISAAKIVTCRKGKQNAVIMLKVY